LPSVPRPAANPIQVELEAKRNQRNTMLKQYTPDHPDIKRLNKEIAVLEERLTTSQGESTPSPESTGPQEATVSSGTGPDEYQLQIAQLRTQVEDLRVQVQRRVKEQEKIREEMASYQAKVDSVPKIEQLQKELMRDYDITSKHYQELLGKKNEAEMATNLERRQKGEQFRILDPPSLPQSPARPDRRKLKLGGLLGGFVIGLALALGLELLNETVSSELEVVRLTNLPILVSLPVIAAAGAGQRSFIRKLIPWGLGNLGKEKI
jgi:uncharacterized protein involved in exopolysaccharide biosynthesis